MLYFHRQAENNILGKLIPGKVCVIVGARRVGKTYLIKRLLNRFTEPYLLLNGENINTIEQLSRRSTENYLQLLQNKKLLVIDEAQSIPDIGRILKLMVDEIEGLKIIVTGSSAFDLKNKLGEPLTGRKYDFQLYALSEKELSSQYEVPRLKETLHERLIWGSYPELYHLHTTEQKQSYLTNLVSSYLLKDILALENLRSSDKILKLLRLIAFQTGREVSFNELSSKVSLNKNTVEKYLDLLTKVYILFRLDSYGTNKRKELTKSKKYYFLDNGIRNTLIANFNPLELRDDTGKLWENYFITERIKYLTYNNIHRNLYFWRSFGKQKIDLIEEEGNTLHAYEIKWKERGYKIPSLFRETYKNTEFYLVHGDNYLDHIGF
jgi:hypothetical protein